MIDITHPASRARPGRRGNTGRYAPLLVAEASVYNADAAKSNGKSLGHAAFLRTASISNRLSLRESRPLAQVSWFLDRCASKQRQATEIRFRSWGLATGPRRLRAWRLEAQTRQFLSAVPRLLSLLDDHARRGVGDPKEHIHTVNRAQATRGRIGLQNRRRLSPLAPSSLRPNEAPYPCPLAVGTVSPILLALFRGFEIGASRDRTQSSSSHQAGRLASSTTNTRGERLRHRARPDEATGSA
jgi:hypothetical protein